MTVIHFTDGILEYPNPKTARAKLRKMGLTVRNATKKDGDYYFDCERPEGVRAWISPAIKPTAIKPMPCVDVGELTPLPVRPRLHREDGSVSLKTIEVDLDTVLQKRLERTIYHTPILGKDLVAGDLIVNFVPTQFPDLTVDYRGIHEVVISAPNITRQENRFLGFYSVESGGVSSYKIDPEETYDVIRKT